MKRQASTHERLAERLANILTKLNVGYRLGVTELADEFQVSKRTIERDFDRLNSYLPLIQDESTKKYSLDPVYLGRFQLQDIQNFAQLSGISDLYPSLDMSFLRSLLDERANQVFSARGYYYEDAQQFAEHFKVLAEAIRQNYCIHFLYNDHVRKVDPYRLIHHQGGWYLAAAIGDELRSYRLSKIEQLFVDTTRTYQPHPELLMLLEVNEGVWFGKHKQVVKISIQPKIASYFKQRFLFPAQHIILEDEAGGLLISCQISHEMQLLPLIRYWIPYVRIVEPVGLQCKLEQELRDYLLPVT